MYDFWIVEGAILMDPAATSSPSWLLAEIDAMDPKFELIAAILIENLGFLPLKGAGFVEEVSTTAVRAALQAGLQARFPSVQVPVSLYTAGKLCQLLNVARRSTFRSYGDARAAMALVTPRPAPTAALLALLGAIFIDTELRKDLMANPASSNFDVFSVSAGDRAFVNGVLGLPGDPFGEAARHYRENGNWEHCKETLLWYENAKRITN